MLLRFIKEWTLPLAIVTGAVAYFLQSLLPFFDPLRPYAARAVAVVQPILIFSMLFLTFCKVDLRQMRPRLAHAALLGVQSGCFLLIVVLLHLFPALPLRTAWEGLMLCMICPTATSAAVVTGRLGGDAADVTSYTIAINLVVSVLVPLSVPLVMPGVHLSFFAGFGLMLSKVFPMLVCPLLAAIAVKLLWPRLHARLASFRNLSFYLWAIALSISIAITVRSIVHSDASLVEIVSIAVASLFACVFQFYYGIRLGRRVGRPVSTAQSIGQKNTVFAIWAGSALLDPLSALAGGFYCVWHNLYNTYQLQRAEKRPLPDKS